MTRSLLISILALALVTACGAIAEPTATPTPSITPTPSDTPTPSTTPTNTPDIPATETRVAERTAAFIEAYGPGLDIAGFTVNQGELAYSASREVILQLNTNYNTRTWEDINTGEIGDFVMNVDVTWTTSTGLSGCGIYFHGDGDFAYGKFMGFEFLRLSGAPVFNLLYIDNNRIGSFIAPRYSSTGHINVTDGATNNFIIVVTHPDVVIYANGERIAGGTLPAAIDSGYLAYNLNQESGDTTCRFNNAWVWELPADE